MNKEEIFNYCLENLKSSEIKKDEPMKKHTSFKIGGNADIFIKSYKSNISESQKSAFLKYRHMVDRIFFPKT